MTEKRFTEIISTQKVIDNQTGNEYDCLIDDDLLELLNELHEEIEVCKQAYCEIKEDAIKKTEENKELKKENEQLKLSNRLLLEEMKEIRDKLTVYLEISKGDMNDRK